MLRLIMRECHQCGFDQSEFSLKTVDISVPEVESEITGGPHYTIIGAEVVARQQKEESPCTASNSDYEAACRVYDEYICTHDVFNIRDFRTYCEQRLHSAENTPNVL